MEFLTFFILAVFIEGTIEYFIPASKKGEWVKYVAALFGIALSFAYNLDLIAKLGVVSTIPFVGVVITGIIIGRGSNYLNDFVGKLRGDDKPQLAPVQSV